MQRSVAARGVGTGAKLIKYVKIAFPRRLFDKANLVLTKYVPGL
jgi:hypothetical protein